MFAYQFIRHDAKGNDRRIRNLPHWKQWFNHRNGLWCDECNSDGEPCFVGLVIPTKLKQEFEDKYLNLKEEVINEGNS